MSETPCAVPSAAVAALRAALYVRASTPVQTLSAAMQEQFMRAYAERHGMQVVRLYLDQGRSGLVLAGRVALQQLLADVCGGGADYSVVLVYDVSRWGRYQNIDQAACYEYVCRQAGISLRYCAEPFENDGSPLSQLIKSYKRSMAAEYSRELSIKVVAGLRLLALRGYKLGGRPMYGLRRIAVSADGQLVRELQPGERKPHATDRVRQAPGSAEELAVIGWIFNLYAHAGLTVAAISRLLNQQAVRCGDGLWTDYKVGAVLHKEQYRGVQVYNRVSRRLRTPCKPNPRSEWLRCDQALAPILTVEQGQLVARIDAMRSGRDRQAILTALRAVYSQHGKITWALLGQVVGMPGWHVLKRLFGSLGAACAEAGIERPRLYPSGSRQQQCRSCQQSLSERIAALVARAGGYARPLPGVGNELLINDSLVLRVLVKPCQPVRGTARWLVPVHLKRPADFVLAGLLTAQGGRLGRYALIATAAEPKPIVRFGASHAPASARVVESLASLFGLADEGGAG